MRPVAFGCDWEEKLFRVGAGIALALRVERDHRQPGRHAFDERQAEPLVAKRQQDVGLPVPTGDSARCLVFVDDADPRVVGLVVVVVKPGFDDQPSFRIIREG